MTLRLKERRIAALPASRQRLTELMANPFLNSSVRILFHHVAQIGNRSFLAPNISGD